MFIEWDGGEWSGRCFGIGVHIQLSHCAQLLGSIAKLAFVGHLHMLHECCMDLVIAAAAANKLAKTPHKGKRVRPGHPKSWIGHGACIVAVDPIAMTVHARLAIAS